tara:strand:- start:4244 stop:4648 length:405 start_codon:yes stop_codon:yes gene_type:complete
MEEIDQYLSELDLQTKVNDYIKYGIKPTYQKQIIKHFPIMDTEIDNKLSIKPINMNLNISNMINKCDKIRDELLQDTTQNESMNECPICFQKIEEASYVTPKCGHKVCLKCYICCLEKRTTYSNSCCICRKDIL